MHTLWSPVCHQESCYKQGLTRVGLELDHKLNMKVTGCEMSIKLLNYNKNSDEVDIIWKSSYVRVKIHFIMFNWWFIDMARFDNSRAECHGIRSQYLLINQYCVKCHCISLLNWMIKNTHQMTVDANPWLNWHMKCLIVNLQWSLHNYHYVLVIVIILGLHILIKLF